MEQINLSKEELSEEELSELMVPVREIEMNTVRKEGKLHKYLWWLKAYALRNVRKDMVDAIIPGWEAADIRISTAERTGKCLWKIYSSVYLKSDPSEWANGFFYYDAVSGKLFGKKSMGSLGNYIMG